MFLFAPLAPCVGSCAWLLLPRCVGWGGAWRRRRRRKAPAAADGDGLCSRRCDGRTSPVSQLTEMDVGRTASLFRLIILSVHSSHRPQAPRGSGATTIRTAASQSNSAIDVDPSSPCLRTAAVLLHSSFSSCVCRARMILLLVVQCRLIGHTSDASGHVCFCLGSATWHGGCVGCVGGGRAMVSPI
ncbi:putative retrotransposon hot spot (RHS) protein [Trypanosoma cruzi]|nr:putative retrotransposon hot spot (RHS) protein [Trypanosoma cruzi]